MMINSFSCIKNNSTVWEEGREWKVRRTVQENNWQKEGRSPENNEDTELHFCLFEVLSIVMCKG